MKTLQLPPRVSLATVIFEKLQKAILNDELKPGKQINEKAIAEQNGVSRGPIREACRRLEQSGLVEIIVNRGVFVRKISPGYAIELCDLRIVLAVYVGQLAVKRINNTQIQILTALMEKIEVAVRSERLNEFSKLNAQFHTMILEIAGNSKLMEIYSGINKELSLCRWHGLTNNPDLEEALRGHKAIVDALSVRNVEQISIAMENHLSTARDRLMIAIK